MFKGDFSPFYFGQNKKRRGIYDDRRSKSI